MCVPFSMTRVGNSYPSPAARGTTAAPHSLQLEMSTWTVSATGQIKARANEIGLLELELDPELELVSRFVLVKHQSWQGRDVARTEGWASNSTGLAWLGLANPQTEIPTPLSLLWFYYLALVIVSSCSWQRWQRALDTPDWWPDPTRSEPGKHFQIRDSSRVFISCN